ncbi:MAG: LacI family DNA-binding transcriptional regulator [Geminicoccaceae bacterium]
MGVSRPTIPDLAKAAGVSVSTVNRVIGGTGKVREPTMQRVLQVAEDIGFYGIGSIQSRLSAARSKDRFVVLLQQRGRKFYEALGAQLEGSVGAFEDRDIDLRVEFMDDLSPDRVASRIRQAGEWCEALAVVAAEHPLVSDAIEQISTSGTKVLGLIAPLNARCNVGYVGLDHWKVGRTAAWAFDHICRQPGKIGILVGNHRYRNQDLNESGFRSYFREHGSAFTLLEPLSTFESSAVGREMTEKLLHDHPDLAGLYISGGGITGALAAIRHEGRAGNLVSVGYELFETTKAGLIDGSLTFLISHPLEKLARETIAGMIRAKQAGADAGSQTVVLNFEIYTRENI